MKEIAKMALVVIAAIVIKNLVRSFLPATLQGYLA